MPGLSSLKATARLLALGPFVPVEVETARHVLGRRFSQPLLVSAICSDWYKRFFKKFRF